MNLIEFYTKVLNNVGITVSEDGYCYIPNGDDQVMMVVEGKPLVLPTKEHLESVYAEDDEGEMTISKLPFNPLNEDIVKGDSSSLKKLKHLIEYKLGHTVAALGESLLVLASNETLQKKANMEVCKFLAEITKAQNQGIKKLVDEKSIDNWCALYENTVKTNRKLVNIYLKKKGKYNNETYNRLGVLSSDVYDILLNAVKDEPVVNVKLRNKDITIFKILIKYILGELDKDNQICVGSNDSESPAFIALFSLYIKVITRTNKLLSHLKYVNKEVSDSYIVNDLITEKELEHVDNFKPELMQIPNDNDLVRTFNMANKSRLGGVNPDVMNKPLGTTPGIPVYPSTSKPVSMKTEETSKVVSDPLMKTLYGSAGQPTMAATQPIGINSVGIGVGGMIQQPMMQQPIGINSIPNIANPGSYYQQPIMQQQPMMGVPNLVQQQPIGLGGMIYR